MNGYAASVREFVAEYRSGILFEKIEAILKTAGVFGSRAELRSWGSTVEHLHTLLTSHAFSEEAYVLLEYRLPLSFRRVDVMVLGNDDHGRPSAVVIEVKMWNAVRCTELPNVVETFVGRADRLVSHPSYQVAAYVSTMRNILAGLAKVRVMPCVWMTNARKRKMQELFAPCYKECLKEAPVFFNDDHEALAALINKATCGGKGAAVLQRLLDSPLRPAKKLADAVASMLHGNAEFVLQENQQIAFASVMANVRQKDGRKHVYVINGGPGTGKSVLAVNLLAETTKAGLSSFYVAPNSSFRAIIRSKVTKKTHKETADVITGSAVYNELRRDALDCVIVDEAHRLKDKRARGYRGTNQISDIVRAARTAVFFIDELQTIRPEDIGYVKNITDIAAAEGAVIHTDGPFRLALQLRNPGAEQYVRWVEQALQLAPFGTPQPFDTPFTIVDDPHVMSEDMKLRLAQGYTARFLAGKAWDWSNRIDPDKEQLVEDVAIAEHRFAMPWSMPKTPELWAVSDWGQFQVGSVHSAQGAEFDYAYVLIGTDLVFRDGKVVADPKNSTDLVAKRGYRQDPATFTRLIKQTYRVLLTRGMRGTMVFIRDPALREHFRAMLPKSG